MNVDMNGLILLDKPEGLTSFKAAAALRRIYGMKRVGHTGTLDPMATGVLPVLIGRATRFCSLVLESDKRYTAGVRLGITTDSLDVTGNVLSETPATVSDAELSDALKKFTCTYDQVPPMYSALKKDGMKLCDLARKGIEVERNSRTVTIKEINLLSREGSDFTIDVLCSKGTYIRSLADDIGKYLGCGAALFSLRRTKTAQFGIESCASLDDIRSSPEKYLLPAEKAVEYLPMIELTDRQKLRFINGAGLSFDRVGCDAEPYEGMLARAYCGGLFLGLAEYFPADGEFKTKCVVNDGRDD